MNILCYSLIHLQFLRASDAKLIFLKVNFQVTDLSKDGLPRVKVFIPDSMPQATVQYDKETMVVLLKDPSLGWVARIEVVRNTLPMHPNLFRSKTIEKLVLATRNWNRNRAFGTRIAGVKCGATSEYLHLQLTQRE